MKWEKWQIPEGKSARVTFHPTSWLSDSSSVTVKWDQEIDDGTWDRFVAFMEKEGYLIKEQKDEPPWEWWQLHNGGIMEKFQIKGESGKDANFRRDIGQLLERYGFKPGPAPSNPSEAVSAMIKELDDFMEVIRGNRQA